MWRSARVFLVTSILFGATTLYLYWQGYGLNSISALLIVVAGLAYGLTLSLCAYFLTKFLKVSLTNFLRVLLVLSVAGLILGTLLLRQVYQIPHGNWTQLQSPPEKPVKFLANSPFDIWGGTIYVETDRGNIFSHTCDEENPCYWKEEESVPKQPAETFWTCPPNHKGEFQTPPAPGRVLDSREVNVCGVDYGIQINFILLDNGTIWVWNKFSSAIEATSRFLTQSVLSFGIGFLGAFALLVGKAKGSW